MAENNLFLGPSLGTSSFVWSKAGDVLASDFHVVNFELPGHGPGMRAQRSISIAEVAGQVIELADSLHVDVFHYAGISLGGAVGLELALQYPDRLASLTMVCSAAKFGNSSTWLERAEQVRTQGTSVLVDGSAERWFAPGFIARDPDSAARLLQDIADTDDASYAYLCEALAEFDLRDRLPEIRTRALVLSGEHDGVTPPEIGRFMAATIPAAEYATISGASHLAPVEQPLDVAHAMAGFLKVEQ